MNCATISACLNEERKRLTKCYKAASNSLDNNMLALFFQGFLSFALSLLFSSLLWVASDSFGNNVHQVSFFLVNYFFGKAPTQQSSYVTPSPEIVNTTSMWHYSACRHVGEVSKMEENMFHTKQLHPSPSLQSNNTEKKCFMKKGFSQRELYGLESVGKELPDFLMQR